MTEERTFKTSLAPYRTRFVLIGGLVAASTPHYLKTVLGSCVSVCMWDEKLRTGSMNHFILPRWNKIDMDVNRYGDVSMQNQFRKMQYMGSEKEDLRAMVFGGGHVLCSNNNRLDTGRRNVELALNLLKELGMRVVVQDVGENYGRNIEFDTYNGTVSLKKLKRLSNRYCPNFDIGRNRCVLCGKREDLENDISDIWQRFSF